MSWFEANEQLFRAEQASLLARYPELQFKLIDGQCQVDGLLRFSATFEGCEIQDAYSIVVCFPDDYPNSCPVVKETNGKIPHEYHHNPDGTLCLTTPVQALMMFRRNPTVIGFIEKLLIPYLYRFSFEEKHRRPPFPEFTHGAPGLIEYYSEYFGTTDIEVIMELLYTALTGGYRGHAPCPCNNGKRMRNCHGQILRDLPTEPLRHDYVQIFDHLKKIAAKKGVH